jgi:hypothetical protein
MSTVTDYGARSTKWSVGSADAAGYLVGRKPDDDALLWRCQCRPMCCKLFRRPSHVNELTVSDSGVPYWTRTTRSAPTQ